MNRLSAIQLYSRESRHRQSATEWTGLIKAPDVVRLEEGARLISMDKSDSNLDFTLGQVIDPKVVPMTTDSPNEMLQGRRLFPEIIGAGSALNKGIFYLTPLLSDNGYSIYRVVGVSQSVAPQTPYSHWTEVLAKGKAALVYFPSTLANSDVVFESETQRDIARRWITESEQAPFSCRSEHV